jgi:HemY protein
LSKVQQLKLTQTVEKSFTGQDSGEERDWLALIESAQKSNPREPLLQFLAGRLCLKRQLWGKAQLLLSQAAPVLADPVIRRQAWRSLAELAEQREDLPAAVAALKQAAME